MNSVVLVGASLLLVLASAIPAGAQKTAERPALQAGQRWVLDAGEFTLATVARDRYVFTASGGHEVHLSLDLVPIRIVRQGRTTWEMSPAPSIRWPLEVGRWGSGRTGVQKEGRDLSFSVSNLSSADMRATWRVQALEPLLVAGRQLSTFRVVIEFQAGDPSFYAISTGTLSLWYAPDVRQVVKVESTGTIGLGTLAVTALDGPPVVAGASPPVADRPAPAPVPAPAVQMPAPPAAATPPVKPPEVAATPPPMPPKMEDRPSPPAAPPPAPVKPAEPVAKPAPAPPAPSRPPEIPPVTATRPPAPPTPRAEPAEARPAAPSPTASLRLSVSAPADGTRVQQDSIGLAGIVTGGEGIRHVVVTLNGVEIKQLDQPAARASLPLNLPVTLREGANTLVVTATDGAGQSQQEVRTVHLDKLTPLMLSVSYPADQARLTQDSTVVVATATSSKGVAKVAVSVNGVPVADRIEAATRRSVPVNTPITLREGANAIVIVATDTDGTVRQEVRTVFYDAPKVAVAPAPAFNVREQWAVIIGVGQYQNPAIPPLRYTVADAEAVHRTLLDAGFRKENVLLLTDRTERKPTFRDIKWALGTFLARSAKKDDTVLIYFAGHGAPETDPRGIERDGLAKYLIPIDADPDDLYSTAFPMDELQTIFGRVESERVVAFLDACYSGAAGGRTFMARRTRASGVDDLFLERLTRSKGRAIITAARLAEVSVELAELGHGIFTYYLVQGLKGAADGNRDGIVSLQELYEYVEQEVVRKSRSVGSPQHPVMKGEMEGPLPLIKLIRPGR